MKIRVTFLGQARTAIGRSSDEIDCDESTTLAIALAALAEKHGVELRRIILDEHGHPQASVMLFVNDEQIVRAAEHVLCGGDEVTIMPAISGG